MARRPGQEAGAFLAPRVPVATGEQLSPNPPISASSAWGVGCFTLKGA